MAAPVVPLTKFVSVGGESPCFIVAEIGQNHQGNIHIAKKLINISKECGADCVKLQKSSLKDRFTDSALSRPYISIHSWGKTYGEHKEYLEFTPEEIIELQKYATDIGVMFTASGMDSVSIAFLDSLEVPFIKIGSGDADNIPLIQEAAQLNRPLFISTGMLDLSDVRLIYKTVLQYHKQLVLLHCVSAYPTPAEAINLRVIQLYKNEFPDVPIGYSGHELGTTITTAAVALGAKVIERHITLDKQLKGSDHICSLVPEEFRKMVSDIRNVECALGRPEKHFLPCENSCHNKLGKSVVASKDLPRGTCLTKELLKIKVSEPQGVSCRNLNLLLGKTLNVIVKKDYPIQFSDLY